MAFSVKKDCIHYKYKKCNILNSGTDDQLNCETKCKCSFYETFEQYAARQRKFIETHPEYIGHEK